METSDELEGVELAVAAAIADGGYRQIHEDGSIWWRWPSHSSSLISVSVKDYRPDLYLEQAWELDGEGWRWLFSEKLGGESFKFGPYAGNLLVRLWTKDDIFSYVVAVNPADFATKAHAYATARCRAYLKGIGK